MPQSLLGGHIKPLDNRTRPPQELARSLFIAWAAALGTAAAPRARHRKSEAQREKSVQNLQHKKLQSRCEAAATKVGGSPPKVLALACLLACCGRFLELLLMEQHG